MKWKKALYRKVPAQNVKGGYGKHCLMHKVFPAFADSNSIVFQKNGPRENIGASGNFFAFSLKTNLGLPHNNSLRRENCMFFKMMVPSGNYLWGGELKKAMKNDDKQGTKMNPIIGLAGLGHWMNLNFLNQIKFYLSICSYSPFSSFPKKRTARFLFLSVRGNGFSTLQNESIQFLTFNLMKKRKIY